MDAVMLAQSPSAGSLPRGMAPSASGRSRNKNKRNS